MAGNENPLKTRKPHRKSRSGCIPCKARHVKCDESRPVCFTCERYGSKCEYPKPKAPSADSPASTPSLLPILPNTINHGKDPELEIPQLRLLHHFTTVTAKTLAYDADAEDVFSSFMVKASFDHPFLLHGILALSALHLGHLQPNLRKVYALEADRHHQAALSQFRTEVSDITDSNFASVLSFSSLLFAHSWAISINSDDIEYAFGYFLSNLNLTRTVRPLVQMPSTYDKMRQSELGRIIPKDVLAVNWDDPKRPEETELMQLRKFSEVIHHIYPSDIIEAYQDAIIFLEALFSAATHPDSPPSDSMLKSWLYCISPRFVELLSDKQPGALIILAHYGVLLGRNRRYWFLEDVDVLMLSISDAFVPNEWKGWLDWPREEVRKGRANSNRAAS
ncbi:hypothetical protein CC80DRAFT_510016 [Byssothecium circinans]|uniref:Zn(2)-C6 fungal-type domain-containing protein n=1 Tax=Byssothecium circinans TaxID=147558 RepID=A0A6A5TBB5_9PLEO|nr:hypothetical protein CC80DRAFT_510016 [Byssothecium circinans]